MGRLTQAYPRAFFHIGRVSDPSPRGTSRPTFSADAGLLAGLHASDTPASTTNVLHVLFERCADPLALLDGKLRLVRVNDALVHLLTDERSEAAVRELRALLEETGVPPRLERALHGGTPELAIPLGPGGHLMADAHPLPKSGDGGGVLLALHPQRPLAPDSTQLLQLGQALGRARSSADVCRALVADARARGAAAVAVFLPSADGRGLHMVAQEGYSEPVVEMFRVLPMTETMPATDVFRRGEALYITSAGDWERRFAPLYGAVEAPYTVRSAALVPLAAGGPVLGVLAHSYPSPRGFPVAERAALELAGGLAGGALRALELEERAAAAERAKTSFLGILSHEFRTPLSAILGYIDLIDSGPEGERVSPRQAERLERARRSAWHLNELVDGMLHLARLEKGSECCQPRSVDVAEVVRDAAALFQQSAGEKGLTLRVVGADAPVRITTDSAKVRQVLLNIIGNAVKFTVAGSVVITLSEAAGSVRVDVADTGPGIPPQHRPHLFEAFWQADQSDTRSAAGVGLGLTVARKLLDLVGGSARVGSTRGGGTRVTVQLPMEPPVA